MWLFKKKGRGVAMTRAEALGCKPVKNNQIEESRLETGVVRLAYPEGMRPAVARVVKLFGGPHDRTRTRKLDLDELGTAVWDLMDGQRSVRRVIKKFAETYQLHPKEAEISVTTFLRELGKRGLIGLK